MPRTREQPCQQIEAFASCYLCRRLRCIQSQLKISEISLIKLTLNSRIAFLLDRQVAAVQGLLFLAVFYSGLAPKTNTAVLYWGQPTQTTKMQEDDDDNRVVYYDLDAGSAGHRLLLASPAPVRGGGTQRPKNPAARSAGLFRQSEVLQLGANSKQSRELAACFCGWTDALWLL